MPNIPLVKIGGITYKFKDSRARTLIDKAGSVVDTEKQTVGKYLNWDGTEASSGIYRLSDYIPVIPGQAYRVNVGTAYRTSRAGAFYDKDKVFICPCPSSNTTNDAGQYTIVAPNNAAFVRVCYIESNELDQKISLINPIEIVTPEMFGATGDGVADDTAAFNLLFASIANQQVRRVILCLGSYRLSDTITIRSGNLHIIGSGSNPYVHTFIMNSAIPLFNVLNCSVTFEGITIKGVSTGASTTGSGIGIIYNLKSDGTLNGNIDTEVRNCIFNSLATGIRAIGQNIKVVDCSFSQCTYGIEYVDQEEGYYTELRGHIIDRCRFHQLVFGVVNNAKMGSGITRRGIVISNCYADIVKCFYSGFGTNLVLINNTIAYTVPDTISLITIFNEPSVNGGEFLISGNYIDCSPTAGDFSGGKNCIKTTAAGVITGNTLKNSTEHGIELSDEANRSRISNNTLLRCGTDADDTYAIHLDTSENVYYVSENLTDNNHGTNGIGGLAVETSNLSNNYSYGSSGTTTP